MERYADAVAINLWPSRGQEVLGFEIKTRRGDWTKELKNPAKSAEIQQYCDRWWVVAGGRNIVRSGELPPTWGLLVVHGGNGKGRLVCTKEAPKLEPKPLDKGFVLAMLRRAAEREEGLLKGRGDENYHRGWREAMERLDELTDAKTSRVRRELEHLREAVKKFESVSGVTLRHPWHYGEVGQAVKVVLQHLRRPNGHRRALQNAMEPLKACLSAMQALDRTFALLEEDAMGRKT